jgi:hypothetical protein
MKIEHTSQYSEWLIEESYPEKGDSLSDLNEKRDELISHFGYWKSRNLHVYPILLDKITSTMVEDNRHLPWESYER